MLVSIGRRPYKTLANTYTSADFNDDLGEPAALIMSSQFGPVELVNRRAAASASVSSVTQTPQEFYSTFTTGGNRALFNVSPLISTTSPFFMFCRANGYPTDSRAIISLSGITGTRYVELRQGGSTNPVVWTNDTARITGAASTMSGALVVEFTGAELRLYSLGVLLGTSTAALTDLTRDVFGLGVNSDTSGLSINANHRLAGLIYGQMPPSFPRLFAQDPYKAVFKARRIAVPSAAAAGGTTYNVAQNESVTASDLGAAAAEFLAAAAEAASVTDAASALGLFGRTLTEAASAVDAVDTGGGLSAALTEATTAADTQSSQGAFGRTLTETATASDLVVAVAALQAALTEAASATEQQATGPVVTGTMAEAVSAAEVLDTTANLLAAVLEAATTSDAYAAARQLVALASESATAGDAVSSSAPVAHNVSVIEMMAALDAIVGALAGASPVWRLLAARTRSSNPGGSDRPANNSDSERPDQLSTADRSNLQ